MSVYLGVVKGKTVVLPPDAELADGSVVEVRLAQPATAGDGDDAADRQVQEALVAAGLLRRVQPLGARSAVEERPLLRIPGPPVSETVIAERR
jgi:hypothetical protein